MTFDKLGHNKIMITLCGEDMHNFALDYTTLSLYDYHSRKILMRILSLACFKTGVEPHNKNMLVETLPLESGCIILLTLVERNSGHYKFKSKSESICYLLGNSSNFFETIKVLHRQNICCKKNSVYLYNGEYYIIFDYPAIPSKIRHILNEYGKKCGGKIPAARIKESGKEICKTNAITLIGNCL